jgi:hypothetical protein
MAAAYDSFLRSRKGKNTPLIYNLSDKIILKTALPEKQDCFDIKP